MVKFLGHPIEVCLRLEGDLYLDEMLACNVKLNIGDIYFERT